jgi:hypothetical protein
VISTQRIAPLLLVVVFAGCKSSQPPAAAPAAAAAVLQAIPAVDRSTYRLPRDLNNWQNPYLIVRSDGVGLLDLANNQIHIFNADEVPDALAKLPTTAWPYGRIVAIAEAAAAGDSEDERSVIRKNRAIVAGSLQGMQVLIHWVPKT